MPIYIEVISEWHIQLGVADVKMRYISDMAWSTSFPQRNSIAQIAEISYHISYLKSHFISSRYRSVIRPNDDTSAIRQHQNQSWTFCTCFQCFPSRKYTVQSRAEIVIRRIVDYVEDDLLNICVDDLLHEFSNFVRTNIGSISIRSRV